MHRWLVIVCKIDHLEAQSVLCFVIWLLFHFRNVTTVFIYVAAAHYTSDFLHFWLLHPEWCSYNMVLIFLLIECISIVINFMNLVIE